MEKAKNRPKITYKMLQPGEEEAVSKLVDIVFQQFIAPIYKQKGIETFQNYILPDRIRYRINHNISHVITARQKNDIVGVIEVRNLNHIALLFVSKPYQRRGIARALFRKAKTLCIENNSSITEITVHSSPYAVPIYEKLGFKQTGKEKETDGILYIPMSYSVTYAV